MYFLILRHNILVNLVKKRNGNGSQLQIINAVKEIDILIFIFRRPTMDTFYY